MSDGFLFEDNDPATGAWQYDVPWVKASDRTAHEMLGRGGLSVFRQRMTLGRDIKENDLLRQVLYGNPVANPGDMMGMSQYYNTMDPNKAQNAINVFDGGARSGPVTSIWFFGFGLRTIYMASPDGLPFPFLSIGDAAIIPVDWRYAVRIANVGVDSDVVGLMRKARSHLPTLKRDLRPVFYINGSVAGLLKDMVNDPIGSVGSPIRVIAELRGDEEIVT